MDDGVSIIGGTGALGFGLALRFGAARVPVTIGSRDAGRAEEAAGRARDAVPDGSFEGRQNADAAGASDVVFLCVPLRNQAENVVNIRESLREGQLVVDATVPLAAPLGGKATRTISLWQGSCAQQCQELVPDGVRVISALHTVAAPVLADLDATFDEDVLVCGARRDDKRRVAALVERIDGLRCVDAGPLEMARLVEPLTALLIGINGRYRTHAGVRITGLPEGDLFPPLRQTSR